MISSFVLLICNAYLAACFDWSGLKLIRSHVPYVFNNQPTLKNLCAADQLCPYKEFLSNNDACWGFEANCHDRYRNSHQGIDCSNERSKSKYWHQADFGYLEDRLSEMTSHHLCKPTEEKRSSLHCTKGSTMCRARNLYIDLRSVFDRVVRRDKVALKNNEIGGYCDLDERAIGAETATKRDLSTWGLQLESYTQLSFDPFSDTAAHCDVVMSKPVIFVQLDFGGNMYHHFCDFFNLYLTQLANNSWFGTDVQIIRWDTSARYGDLFGSSWKVFTDHDHKSLRDFAGKRVCFSDATFGFLPRMAFGLYYSTPLENNCRGTGLFHAFSHHFLHRMGIIDDLSVPVSLSRDDQPRIRITMLDRGHTDRYKIYRRVLNQDQLVEALHKLPDVDVRLEKYSGALPFEDQLTITRNTDIFIGMHGAGLAHFMFLPDWAVAFELYNCGDIRCYRDLARLCGHRYMTWEDSSKVTEVLEAETNDNSAHAKFMNYKFNVEEFIRLVKLAKSWLLEHERFAHLRTNKDEL